MSRDDVQKITTDHCMLEYLFKHGIHGIKELRIWKSAISVLREIEDLGLNIIHWTFVDENLNDKIVFQFQRMLLLNKQTIKNLFLEETLLSEAPFEQLDLDSLTVLSYNGLFIEVGSSLSLV